MEEAIMSPQQPRTKSFPESFETTEGNNDDGEEEET
jgi:hypothetical protein